MELPEGDCEEGMRGKLYKSMYGTRDAAQNWEAAYTEFMKGIGGLDTVGYLEGLQHTEIAMFEGENSMAVCKKKNIICRIDMFRKK